MRLQTEFFGTILAMLLGALADLVPISGNKPEAVPLGTRLTSYGPETSRDCRPLKPKDAGAKNRDALLLKLGFKVLVQTSH